jgi:hypothetical protein
LEGELVGGGRAGDGGLQTGLFWGGFRREIGLVIIWREGNVRTSAFNSSRSSDYRTRGSGKTYIGRS